MAETTHRDGHAGATGAFLRHERGGVALLAALLFPLFVGGLGLGAETGYWHLKKQRLQHAADAAAHAAAVRMRAGAPQAHVEADARAAAAHSGHLADRGAAAVNAPPAEGAWRGWPGHVEVRLEETHPRLLSAVFVEGDVHFAARAVARVEGGAHACVLALSASAPRAIDVSDAGRTDLSGCAAASNSLAPDSISVSAHAALTAECGFASGSAEAAGQAALACGAFRNRSHPVPDPYAVLPEPARGALPCRTTSLTIGDHRTLIPLDWNSGRPAMRLCGGLRVTGSATLMPGIYFVEGDFEMSSGGHLYGAGVTLYLAAGARMRVAGGSTASLSAPSSGAYAGVAVFSSRAAPAAHEFAGNSSVHFTGAFYAPSSSVAVGGGSNVSSSCAQVVADTVRVSGHLALGRGCHSPGMHEIIAGRQVAIVE